MMNRLNAGYQPTLPRTSVYDKVMRFASGGEVVAPLGSPGAINVGRMIAARRQRLAALIAIDTAEARDEAERLRQEIRVLAENGAGVPRAPEITAQDQPPRRPRSRPEDYAPQAPKITAQDQPPDAPRLPPGAPYARAPGADPVEGATSMLPPTTPDQYPDMARARDERDEAFARAFAERMSTDPQLEANRRPETDDPYTPGGYEPGFDSGIAGLGRARARAANAQGDRGLVGRFIDRAIETAPGTPGGYEPQFQQDWMEGSGGGAGAATSGALGEGIQQLLDSATGKRLRDLRGQPAIRGQDTSGHGDMSMSPAGAAERLPTPQEPVDPGGDDPRYGPAGYVPRSAGAPGSAAPAPSAPARRAAGAAPAAGAPAGTPPTPTPRPAQGIASLGESGSPLAGSPAADGTGVAGGGAPTGTDGASAAAGKPWFDLTDEQAQFLMDLGLGMLASDSPFFGTALGQGGMGALKNMRDDRQRKYEQVRNAKIDELDKMYKTGQLDLGRDRNSLSREELQQRAEEARMQLGLGRDRIASAERISAIEQAGADARTVYGGEIQKWVATVGADQRYRAAILDAGVEAQKTRSAETAKVSEAVDTAWNAARTKKDGKSQSGAFEMPEELRGWANRYALGLLATGQANSAGEAAAKAFAVTQGLVKPESTGFFGGGTPRYTVRSGAVLPATPMQGAPAAGPAENPLNLARPTR